MPGIFGFASQGSPVNGHDLLAEMARRLKHHAWYREESTLTQDGRVGLGRASLGAIQTKRQPACDESSAVLCVLDGEMYGEEGLQAELVAARRSLVNPSHAELLIQSYLLAGKDFFRRIDGKYTAAIWDGRLQRLIVVNDRFGMKPLYYSKLPGRLLIASEIKALVADPETPREQNVRGLAQLFTFGHLLGEDTLLDGVRLLPAGGWLTYDATEDRLQVGTYWSLDDLSTNETLSEATWLDRLDEAVVQAVSRQLKGAYRLGLSLSGGLDARTLLALMDVKATGLQTVSLGMEGSLDHRSAAQLAALVGAKHCQYWLNDGFFADFERYLRTMVHLTDGHYLDQCIVVPTLPLYRELEIDVLLRGHAGELMHMNKAYNFSLDRQAWTIASDAEMESWLFGRLCAYMQSGVEGPLLASISTADLEMLARASLQSCLAESAGADRQLQRVWQMFISQRVRRETAASLAMFGSVVETRVPFMDTQLVELLLSAPPELKVGDRIQSHILRRRRPEFLAVTNSNTGAPIGVGGVQRQLATFRLKAFAKLGIKGFQPYERLGLWLRRQLRGIVQNILLSDRCLDRGVFVPNTVRRVVHQHLDQGRNHTYLLMAMMIYELGQRELIDGDPFTMKNESSEAFCASGAVGR